MHKQSIKNFIYSFLFSLLAVIGVNKVFMHTPENAAIPAKPTLKAQSISLFSVPADNDKATVDKAIDVSEIDKLTTPLLNDVRTKDEVAEFAIGNLPPPPPDAAQNIIVAADLPVMVSENAGVVTAQSETVSEKSFEKPTELSGAVNTDLAASEEIVLEKENIITVAKTTNDYEESGIVYTDISDTFNSAASEPEESQTILYAPEDNNQPAEEKILVAVNNAVPTEQTLVKLNAEENDIPLTESDETLHNSINVVENADAAQIAMLEPNNLVSTIEEEDFTEEKTLAEADLKQNEWSQMSEKDNYDSPWVVAKGNRFAKNQAVVEYFAEEGKKEEVKEAEEKLMSKAVKEDEEKVSTALKPEEKAVDGKETKVAYQMIQNLLIPIPEDILNDTDLTPQLTASPEEKPDKEEQKAEQKAAQTAANSSLNENEKQSGLFKSIASWFSDDKGKSSGNDTKTPNKTADKKSGLDFFGFVSGNDDNISAGQILPAELRLSFQPNRAEISGHTLRWIHAFADNARDNDDMYIEIRIDGTSSFALQKKRLNLLSTILANRGVDFRKINIVFTSREPNSFIIRNIRFNNNEEVVVNKNSNNSYYQPW